MNLIHLIKVITAYRPTPIAKYIKKETKFKHDLIEQHPFIVKLIDKTITDKEYAIYLKNLLPIYEVVESTFFNENTFSELYRSHLIKKDVEQYEKDLGKISSKFIFNKPWLAAFKKKNKIMKKSELYIRWLADAYGGQIIKRGLKYTSKYDIKDVRQFIRIVRAMVEEGLDETNTERFIGAINNSYDEHYKLVDKIYDATRKNL